MIKSEGQPALTLDGFSARLLEPFMTLHSYGASGQTFQDVSFPHTSGISVTL